MSQRHCEACSKVMYDDDVHPVVDDEVRIEHQMEHRLGVCFGCFKGAIVAGAKRLLAPAVVRVPLAAEPKRRKKEPCASKSPPTAL